MKTLNDEEKLRFKKWIIENIDDTIVPADEGNADALVFNIVHLLMGDRIRYNYLPEQDKEIETWKDDYCGN
jgi:hypothetical protein